MPQLDIFDNTGGLNTTDSPFYVKDNQAVGGYNYEYTRTGSITKRLGHQKANSVADTQTTSLGIWAYLSATNTKTILRAAGRKLQDASTLTAPFTNITDDTATPSSDIFASASTQPVVFKNFDTSFTNISWFCGGGASSVYGYTGSKITQNGVPVPTGTFTAVNVGSGTGGAWVTTGAYYYALVLRKASTQALSNAGLDKTITISNATDTVLLTFPTGVDATKYDQWWIYRSAVGGTTSFTTGTLVAKVTVGTASYTDIGSVAVATSQNVPRDGSPILDNGVLPTGTYKSITTYRRRLVTAYNNVVCISALNKPESWSPDLQITLPFGGSITGLATLGVNAPLTGNTDEFLVIFQERNMWIIQGSVVYDSTTGLYDLTLRYVDAIGCAVQSLIANGNGYLSWIDYRGVYIWDGSGKPIYASRYIESLFSLDGDVDKSRLSLGWATYSQRKNMILWQLSHRSKGENKITLKMDLRLTLPKASQNVADTIMEAIFTVDSTPFSLYSGTSYLDSGNQEVILSGDSSGFLYKLFTANSDAGTGIDFSYETRHFNMDLPTQSKRYNKVIAWVDESVDKDLTLQYWSNYRVLSNEYSQVTATLSPVQNAAGSLWDIAVWDVSNWDDYQTKLKPIVFNLNSTKNNNEGDAIKLKFLQSDVNTPVTIHGFSIVYEIAGMRK